ncbi:phosphatase PAP2 family protein [Lentzea nigeriaca]
MLMMTAPTITFGLLLFLVLGKWPPLLAVDDDVRDDVHRYTAEHPAFVTAMKTLSTIGSAPVYLTAIALVAAWLLYRHRPRQAVFVLVTVTGSALLNAVVKRAVQRARPTVPDPLTTAHGLSFPSGHAQSAAVTYATVLVVFWPVMRSAGRRVAVVLAAAMVLGIGLSRVALAVHYVSDVLAGYALGTAWFLAMVASFTLPSSAADPAAASTSEGG